MPGQRLRDLGAARPAFFRFRILVDEQKLDLVRSMQEGKGVVCRACRFP
jgi:hypothetical protein